MKTQLFLSAVALLLASAPQLALADINTTFNTPAAGGHGFYNGSGNIDGDFTTVTADYGVNSISISLRGAQRNAGPIVPTGPAGNVTDYACSSGESCNFEWSVSTTGSLTIGSFIYNLIVYDLTKGTSLSFDPSGLTGLDDSYWTGSKTSLYDANATGFQNSEFFGFNFITSPLNYSQTDQVLVTLSAQPKNSALADPSATIGFNTTAPVPEPSAIILFGTLALGLFLYGRRRLAA
jgi:hypothetical protein